MNLRGITELKVRIQNLNDLLNSTIRYREDDLGRLIREKIKQCERELIVLQNQVNNGKTNTPTP